MQSARRRTATGVWAIVGGLLWLGIATLAWSEESLGHGALHTSSIHGTVRILSWQALRYKNIAKQTTDSSCGAASLATLLQAFYGLTVSETEMITQLQIGQSTSAHDSRGVSFADMARVVEQHYSLRAIGLALGFDGLLHLRLPVIVYLKINAAPHFAVLRGISAYKVYLADPAAGNRVLWRHEFIRLWQIRDDAEHPGRILVILPPTNTMAELVTNAQFFQQPPQGPLPLDLVIRHR